MAIRAIIIYLFVLIVVRLMGKRQIGEMQPFELVITLIIADLACIPMAEVAVPLGHGLIPILRFWLFIFVVFYFAKVAVGTVFGVWQAGDCYNSKRDRLSRIKAT